VFYRVFKNTGQRTKFETFVIVSSSFLRSVNVHTIVQAFHFTASSAIFPCGEESQFTPSMILWGGNQNLEKKEGIIKYTDTNIKIQYGGPHFRQSVKIFLNHLHPSLYGSKHIPAELKCLCNLRPLCSFPFQFSAAVL
jgi:hypothetical protein